MRINRLPFAGSKTVCSLAAALLAFSMSVDSAEAQRSRGGQPNLTTLDRKAEDAQDAFMRTSAELAREYEDLGELERAQAVLRTMLKLNPSAKQIEDKIKELDEIRLSQNEAAIEVDPTRGWVSAKVGVEKGNKIRFLAEGECRVTISQMVSPDGVPSGDVKTELVSGVPLGALMGLIVDQKGKSGKPFAIGQKTEATADTTGQLFLRVNLPPQTKATGKFKVQVTGDIATADSRIGGR